VGVWNHAAEPAIRGYLDQQITVTLDETQTAQYQRDLARHALHAAWQVAHLAGYDLATVIERITAAPSTAPGPSPPRTAASSGSTSSPSPQPATWVQRTPASAPWVAHAIAGAGRPPHRRDGAAARPNTLARRPWTHCARPWQKRPLLGNRFKWCISAGTGCCWAAGRVVGLVRMGGR
jgi:hypothetical protein